MYFKSEIIKNMENLCKKSEEEVSCLVSKALSIYEFVAIQRMHYERKNVSKQIT